MATIPLPALDVRPPAAPDLLGQYAKLMQIQSMQQDHQLQQGQQQLQQGQIQQQQQQLGATDALNKAFQGAIKVDPNTGQPSFDRNAVLNSVSQAGYGAKVPELTESFNRLDQSAANLQKTQTEVEAAKQDYFGNLANSIKTTAKNPDGSFNMDLVNANLAHAAAIPAYSAKAIQLQQQIQQNPNMLGPLLDQVIAASPKQRELAASEAQAHARQSQADKPTDATLAVAAAGGDPNAQKALSALKPPPDSVDKNSEAAWLAKNPGKDASDYVAWKSGLAPAARVKVEMQMSQPQGVSAAVQQGQTGDAVLQSLPPAQRGVVKAILEGRQSAPSGFAQKTPYWQGVMQNVYAVDPQWSEQRAQIRKNFTTGSTANNIGALNTATVHLDTLADVAKALDNGSFRPGNEVFNAARTMFGGSTPTNFSGVKSAVAGEMAEALKGNATDIEIANISKDIDAKNSPKQLADYINTQMHVLNQKLGTYQQRYQQQLPGDTTYSPVLPAAQAVFQKHGIGGGAQAAAQQATPIYATNPQTKARVVSNDGGRTWQPAQ